MQVSFVLPLLQGATAAEPEADFRGHVWVAYALVLCLLALFSLWALGRTRRLERRIEQLNERLEVNEPKATAASGRA
jgi:hypothetical protein